MLPNLKQKFNNLKKYSTNVNPNNVHDIIGRKMLVNGYDFVFDLDKSHGSYIYDSKTNKEYLDMFSFFGSCAISHNHPKLNNDEFKQKIGAIAIHNPSNSDVYTQEFAQFVDTFERVCMPPEFKHLFFISTGTLAVENALKVAFDWKTRKNMENGKFNCDNKVIHFKEAFHGRSGYSLSLTNTDPAKYKYFPLFNWPRINNPKITFPLCRGRIKNLDYEENKSLSDIKYLLETDGDNHSAIILEPIQGEGGDNHFRKSFWQGLRKLADEYNVMLIADEVQAGMGITGKQWAYQHLGAVPDIVCFGKKAQVCGIMRTDRVNEVKDNVFVVPSRINSTWGGSLVDMVRSQKIIEIIEEDKLVENARIVGDYLLEYLHELSYKHTGKITNIRGKGLMCAFDFIDTTKRDKLIESAYKNNLIIMPCGEKSVRLRPLLDVKYKNIDKLCTTLDDCIKKLNNE